MSVLKRLQRLVLAQSAEKNFGGYKAVLIEQEQVRYVRRSTAKSVRTMDGMVARFAPCSTTRPPVQATTCTPDASF